MRLTVLLLALMFLIAPASALELMAPPDAPALPKDSGIELGLRNLVEDVSPQLGANLDGQTFNFTTTGDADVSKVLMDGTTVLRVLDADTNGADNTFLGFLAGENNDVTDGNSNVMLGYSAGRYNYGGHQSVFVGNYAGINNYQGDANVCIGYEAGRDTRNADAMVSVGKQANGSATTYVTSVAITDGGTGYTAGALVVDDTGTGGSGFTGTYTVSGGVIDGITITNNGTKYHTVPSVTGDAGGSDAVLTPALGSAQYNTAVGYYALRLSALYAENVAFGYQAFGTGTEVKRAVAVGARAGQNADGLGNTFIGWSAGQDAGGTKCVMIGYDAGSDEAGDNKLYVHNSNSVTPLIYGEFDGPLLVINGQLAVGIDAGNPSCPLNVKVAAADTFGINLNGTANDYTGTGNTIDYGIYCARDLNAGDGNEPTSFRGIHSVVNPKHTHAVVDNTAKTLRGISGAIADTGTWSQTTASNRTVTEQALYGLLNIDATFSTTGTGRIWNANHGVRGEVDFDGSFDDNAAGAVNLLFNYGGYFSVASNPTLTAGALTHKNHGVYVTVASDSVGTATNYGVYIAACTGADKNYAIWDASGASWILDGDSQKIYWGEAQDYSIEWDGDDAVHTISAGSFVFTGGNVGIGEVAPDEKLEVNGNVHVVGKVYSGVATVSDAGPTNNVDVAACNTVLLDTSDNSVTIGGFINGVAGQVIHVVRTSTTNDAILEHNESTGNQDTFLAAEGDHTLTTYGGWTLVCDGTHWYEVGY